MNTPTLTLPKRLCLTGGGTAGHVMPHLALLPSLQQASCEVLYIGERGGIEAKLLADKGVRFHSIITGKLRRYVHWKTLFLPFAVILGTTQALWHLWRFKPNMVFSKGGYVALPVVYAAWLLRIPCVAHESDLSVGLTNRLSYPVLKKLCLGFAATQSQFRHAEKTVFTGTPVRASLKKHAQRDKAIQHTHLHADKTTLLVFGGSMGSLAINEAVRASLDTLTHTVQIIHICGNGHLAPDIQHPAYWQTEFADESFPDLLACADLTLSRAGANTLAELIATAKPNILVPLPSSASRGDQLLNAQHFAELGISTVIEQHQLTAKILEQSILHILAHKQEIKNKIYQYQQGDATQRVLEVLGGHC